MMVDEHRSHIEKPQARLLLVIPLLPLAFLSKVLYTLYLGICFIILFWFSDWSELGVKLSGLKEGLRSTWYFFVLTLVALPPPVWFLMQNYLPEFYLHVFNRVRPIDVFQFILLGVIVIPFIEEVIFRGVVQEQLYKYTGKIVALLFSSFLFAIVHWSSGELLLVGVDLFLVFLDSLWFGLIYMKSRNVLLSTLCHSLGNLSVFLYGVFILGIVF